MNKTMVYRGYVGSVEFSERDGMFFGKVQGVRSLISYEGRNESDLVADFHGAVDDYLLLCQEDGSVPQTSDSKPLQHRMRKADEKRAG